MRAVILALCLSALAACSGNTGLAPGLTARMDAPGAQLDRSEAFNILNQFRGSRGVSPLTMDAELNTRAQQLAENYAGSNTRPQKPEGIAALQVSAGYTTFAETFSGWRNVAADAGVLAAPGHSRAGLGVAYSPNSTYGVHWVLLLDDGGNQ